MKKEFTYLLNGAEISEDLFMELSSFCTLNCIPYRRNDIGELVGDDYFVKQNLQIEMLPFAKFLLDLYERKQLYFQKCCENEII